jgi:hypothetical protein
MGIEKNFISDFQKAMRLVSSGNYMSNSNSALALA